jgi:lipopolysaccharide/colanic/teichoic acid biosynthesis glycosyltransferase
MKRLVDIVGSAVGLVLLAPVFGVAALWVAIDSPGPILFRQQRVGRGGKAFEMLKLRTMRVGAQKGSKITIGEDPRVTRSGRFLRRFKIDELPQLVNVFRGDMSLVGPRPEVEHYVKLYPADARSRIASVRPGITGLASLEFRNENELLGSAGDPEAMYVQEILPAKLAYDLRYVDEQSVLLDLRIITRTVLAVFTRGERSGSTLNRTALNDGPVKS